MKRVLIVNADDCNLTPGVTRAIFECHDRGILSSTTFMINLPAEAKTVKEIKKRKNLGVGIHLNVTFAEPLSKIPQIRSLVSAEGRFKKLPDQLSRLPKANELAREYQTQIDRFQKVFGRRPTHLDTHHQTHNHPFFLNVLSDVAKRNRLPIRRSVLMLRDKPKIKTTDYIFGNLSPENHWREEWLEALLPNLPSGVSEIMCHPGIHDAALEKVTSFREGREAERKIFSNPKFRAILQQHHVRLAHFGLCYT